MPKPIDFIVDMVYNSIKKHRAAAPSPPAKDRKMSKKRDEHKVITTIVTIDLPFDVALWLKANAARTGAAEKFITTIITREVRAMMKEQEVSA